jgi:hypothetical protein
VNPGNPRIVKKKKGKNRERKGTMIINPGIGFAILDPRSDIQFILFFAANNKNFLNIGK